MIEYKYGDVLANIPNKESGKTIIVPHVTNNIPLWGSGIVVGIMKKWPGTKERHYAGQVELGIVQYDEVEDNVILANMCAQKGISYNKNEIPLQYDHLITCMINVRNRILNTTRPNCEIMTCKFGSGRAMGDWIEIEVLINEIWCDIPVTIFEYKE